MKLSLYLGACTIEFLREISKMMAYIMLIYIINFSVYNIRFIKVVAGRSYEQASYGRRSNKGIFKHLSISKIGHLFIYKTNETFNLLNFFTNLQYMHLRDFLFRGKSLLCVWTDHGGNQ